jgi:hypothetical protein
VLNEKYSLSLIIKMLAVILLGLSVSASTVFKEGVVEKMLNRDVEGPGGTNVIIDISAYQPNVNFSEVWNSGVRAIIHRASQGAYYTDPYYAKHKAEAKEHGFLWGAYHFGTGQSVDD